MKVCRVRWCVQCEEILSKKCVRCIKHPDRKPRIVELIGTVNIIETGPCGCVRFSCQRVGCPKTMWRHLRLSGKTSYAVRNHFCSTSCCAATTADKKRLARPMICAYPPCGRVRLVQRSELKGKTRIFCSGKCFHINKLLENEQRRRLNKDEMAVQAYVCNSPRCRGAVTDHTRLQDGQYDCVRCHARSTPPKIKMEAA